ncbi:MAG: hypothetical protein H7Y31_02120, partial [Chitinophagaceae bacterium]|nr:hypothetical protein [Chitinophagaceae bacterium]
VKLKSLDQWNYNCEDCYLKVLDEQIRQYKLEHGTNKYTWLSWNSADASIAKYFDLKTIN